MIKRLHVEQCFYSYFRVYEVWRPGTGVIGAKVMKEEDFETKEWRKKFKSICIEVPFCNDVLNSDSHFDGNLDCLIESKQDLPIPCISAIMRQLLEGVRIMHEKGIIHRFRDIKGQNILLHSPPGSGLIVLKIADFGLIKEQKQVEQSTLMTVAGTMPLMSSEILMGTEDGEVKADSKV
ncbi:MAG: hypothetical protein EZS28_008062 [Streblomastix strix]|uniref:Protein kinase domain-containing protein n=1 Tax=Streblomastix strix TaxID=222440 RepID=A0A5J4WN62_9EUKA|nr:MAG: hypothetical protein EZS28_008062 [Streblomastix strix]